MKQAVLVLLVVVVLPIGIAFSVIEPAQAQGPSVAGFYMIRLCSAVDYDAVAAEALNLAPTDLRLALVSGQVLEDIAHGQNVAPEVVQRALLDAHLVEIDQALSDGLIDAQQAQMLKTLLTNRNQPIPRPLDPSGTALYPAYDLPSDLNAYNFQAVKLLMAAASQLDLKCADLAQQLVDGRSRSRLSRSPPHGDRVRRCQPYRPDS